MRRNVDMRIFNSTAAVIKNLAAFISMVFCYIYILISWSGIPEKVPGHFDSMGNVTSWSGKGTVWLMPIIMLAMFVLLTVIGMFPSLWNTGVKVTEENRERIYSILKGMLDTIKLTICLTFTVISLYMARCSALPSWFMAVTLVLILGPIAVYLALLFRER